jgi:hypothetical protein
MVPATRVITPPADTLRTTWLFVSAIRNPPSLVTATPTGRLSCASVAGPSSPTLPEVPVVPATLVINPFPFPHSVSNPAAEGYLLPPRTVHLFFGDTPGREHLGPA